MILDFCVALRILNANFPNTIVQQLPMEFAVEATKLLGLKLEGSVG
ncbi:MAG: hypothetical protein HYU73_23565 [Betaproteobacteria bacterium]|nr:hypothetical protein [Betaproteobacteria bacterium]